jgi:hypothetical protein
MHVSGAMLTFWIGAAVAIWAINLGLLWWALHQFRQH